MDPDRKQQTNLNDEDDNFITEYKQEVIQKPWSKTLKLLVAITTLILAVVGTLASFKAASLGNQVVTTQNEAFNHWSNYQAKTIKKTTLETELYTIEIELAKLKDTDNALKTELLAKKAIYEQEIAQYKQEEITLTAKAQEAEQRHLKTIIGTRVKYDRNNEKRKNKRRNENGLTPKQQELQDLKVKILQLKKEKMKNKEIANKLSIQLKTLERHISSMKKDGLL